jgi:hypothetical protein
MASTPKTPLYGIRTSSKVFPISGMLNWRGGGECGEGTSSASRHVDVDVDVDADADADADADEGVRV